MRKKLRLQTTEIFEIIPSLLIFIFQGINRSLCYSNLKPKF